MPEVVINLVGRSLMNPAYPKETMFDGSAGTVTVDGVFRGRVTGWNARKWHGSQIGSRPPFNVDRLHGLLFVETQGVTMTDQDTVNVILVIDDRTVATSSCQLQELSEHASLAIYEFTVATPGAG